jgi:hypothetical protein
MIVKHLVCCLLFLVGTSAIQAQDTKADKPAEGKALSDGKAEAKAEGKSVSIELAAGKIVMKSPAEWKQVTPRFPQMVPYEFNYPADAKAGEAPVRITVMPSGGGIEGNLQRWYGQFTQPDGKATKDVAKVEKFEASGKNVHLVKITGTFSGGMQASGKPGQKKENYMLVGGIIEANDAGTFFVTMTGPKEDCEKLSENFVKMLKAMEAK